MELSLTSNSFQRQCTLNKEIINNNKRISSYDPFDINVILPRKCSFYSAARPEYKRELELFINGIKKLYENENEKNTNTIQNEIDYFSIDTLLLVSFSHNNLEVY